MGFFDLFSKKQTIPEQTQNKRSVDSGVIVTEWPFESDVHVAGQNTAMKLSAVFRSTDILSGSIASLPLLPKIKRGGVFQTAEADKLYSLLTVKPNDRMNAYDFIRNAIIQMVNAGNAYILPGYDGTGSLDSLILVSPNCTSYDKHRNLYEIFDIENKISGTFYPEEVIHLKNMSLDGGYTGVSTITYASRILNITANADERVLDSFKPGNTLRGFVSGDTESGVQGFGSLQDEQLATITDRIDKEISSGKKIFRVPGAAKFNQLSLTASDLQLLENRKFGVLDICRFYGVHPDKVFAGQSQNYKASEQSNSMFLSDTLQPRLRQIECEFTSKLIPPALFGKMKIEFDVESLMLLDLQTQSDYMEKTIMNGVYTVNYWRGTKGQLPVDGGDTVFVSNNIKPINQPPGVKNIPTV